MKDDLVVDTSVAVKWVLAEPDSGTAAQVVADVRLATGRLLILDLALIEAANVIWVRQHRGLLTAGEATSALDLLRQAPVEVVAALPLLPAALQIAMQFGIAVYDAVFVTAVHQIGGRGVTADLRLSRTVAVSYPSILSLVDWPAAPHPSP